MIFRFIEINDCEFYRHYQLKNTNFKVAIRLETVRQLPKEKIKNILISRLFDNSSVKIEPNQMEITEKEVNKMVENDIQNDWMWK
jgi:UDP-galactopyranose mutase